MFHNVLAFLFPNKGNGEIHFVGTPGLEPGSRQSKCRVLTTAPCPNSVRLLHHGHRPV